MFFIFTESKILIATGIPYDDGTNTEIIDVGINSNYSCPKVQPFPVLLDGATGGLINGQPFLCGGSLPFLNGDYHYVKDCYKLTNSGSWTKDDTVALNEARSGVYGSVVLKNKLFISGGYNGNYLNTIEMLSPDATAQTLSVQVFGLEGHCQVSFSSDQFMVIGGYRLDDRAETYFVNVETNQLTNGPSLKTARSSHGCGELEVDGKSYVIVSGGYNNDGGLRSTEILDKDKVVQGWQNGKNIIKVLSQ